jgi:cyclophilin family peptidyl-prolyl cis-trans isomerase
MARTSDPHSATAQFFINTQDNPNLDYSGGTNSRTWGYAVFGKVSEGMDVVDEIRFVATTSKPPFSDVPRIPVVIESIEIISQ